MWAPTSVFAGKMPSQSNRQTLARLTSQYFKSITPSRFVPGRHNSSAWYISADMDTYRSRLRIWVRTVCVSYCRVMSEENANDVYEVGASPVSSKHGMRGWEGCWQGGINVWIYTTSPRIYWRCKVVVRLSHQHRLGDYLWSQVSDTSVANCKRRCPNPPWMAWFWLVTHTIGTQFKSGVWLKVNATVNSATA